MPTFVKKPAEVEAIQFTGGAESAQEVVDWITERGGGAGYVPPTPEDPVSGRVEQPERIDFDTPAGRAVAWSSWYVAHTERDGFYSRASEDFEATYDTADEG